MERERQRREHQEQERRENEAKTEYALRWWHEAVCIWDTPAQTYLASRRCDGLFPPDRDAVFRFHQRCKVGGEYLPCLLTLLRNVETDEPQAIQRTALTPAGKKIGDRMTLGPKDGAAIKLWPHSVIGNHLVVGEGMETVLSTALRIRHRGGLLQPAWACIDAGNLAKLPVLPAVQYLAILVDNDEPNERGKQPGQDAAKKCSERWVNAGREVRRLTPKRAGSDFNDIARS
jgi:putative DNA primase/helicase